MELYIGGFGQGKLNYVKNRLKFDENYVIVDGEKCGDLQSEEWKCLIQQGRGCRLILNHFHLWIRSLLAQGINESEQLEQLVRWFPNVIVISDEVGNGIVPMSEEERCYREQTGRGLCWLAARARRVERIFCGIGQVIKEVPAITFVRHGSTLWNELGRYLGKTDLSLSQDGALEVAKWGMPQNVDLIFVSPMKRCMETASIIYPGKELVVIQQWSEIDFGEFEGKNYEELSGDERYQQWIDSNGTLPFPSGETREEFIKRCMEGFGEAKQIIEKKHAMNVVAVVHGGTVMSLASQILGGDYYDYQIKNGEQLCITI